MKYNLTNNNMKKKQPKKKGPLKVVEATGSIVTSKGTEVTSAKRSEPKSRIACKACS